MKKYQELELNVVQFEKEDVVLYSTSESQDDPFNIEGGLVL